VSATDLVPAREAGALEQDPVQYMAVVLHRAKQWLDEAQSIEEVRERKAMAVTLETVIREKELAFDAELAATELVRRCERRIGQLVRDGQEEGTVLTRGQRRDLHRDEDLKSATELMGVAPGSIAAVSQHYSMADAAEGDFESALDEARQEGNLSRANVVRKVKNDRDTLAARTAALRGETRKPAPAPLDTKRGQIQAGAHARRFSDFVHAMEGYAAGIDALDIDLIHNGTDTAELTERIRSLSASLRKLGQFRNALKEARN
jgi:hypothetical protein